MKKDNTSKRLKEIMSMRHLRQIDILNLTKPFCDKYSVKMNKSDISQYVSGKNEPSQDKLVVLGMALNVNEAWLMGYDVPMERTNKDTSEPLTEETGFMNFLNLISFIGYDATRITNDSYEIHNEKHQLHFNISKDDLYELHSNILNYACYVTDKFMNDKYVSMLNKSTNKICDHNIVSFAQYSGNDNINSVSKFTDVTSAKAYLEKYGNSFAAFNGGKGLSDKDIISIANIIYSDKHK